MSGGEHHSEQDAPASLYIGGYFTSRIEAGERPKYGYPANHLPKTTSERMDVATSFMVCNSRA